MNHRSIIVSLASLVACGGAPDALVPAEAPPNDDPALLEEDDVQSEIDDPEAVDTGFDCAKGEAVCEGGVCTVTLNNACEGPITCELRILALCRGETEVGEARGVGRDTIPPGQTSKLQAGADCQGRSIAGTQVDELRCR